MKKQKKEAPPIDAKQELAHLKEKIAVIKKRILWNKSKLQKYHAELVQLRQAGASLTELQLWLIDHRMKAARTTIRNFLLQHGIEKGTAHGSV